MARYQVDIQKVLGGEYWTNVYYLEAISLAAAVIGAQAIVAAEKVFHSVLVSFDRASVRSAIAGDDIYALLVLTGTGAISYDISLLALFNTLNVVLGAETGRPSRKYYRGCLYENQVAFNTVDATTRTTAQDALATLIGNTTTDWDLVDVDGQLILSAACAINVGMHQLRRGAKRRATPVIPQ